MTLIGGPFNGKEIEDIGTVTQKLSIHRPRGSDTECGYAVYEPSEDRSVSFWAGNLWDGSVLIEEGR